MDIPLWNHQHECVEYKRDLPKSVINIWCGGGKTRIIVFSILEDGKILNIIVFPSLGLINQFNNDYILSKEFRLLFKDYNCLSVCSESENKLKKPLIDSSKFPNIKYTTDKKIVKNYLNKKGKKLFTVTYQSLDMFMNIIVQTKTKINRLYYDEAHHILGSNIQNIVFKNDDLNGLVEKTEYYTATPENRNGIIMFDKENSENSDCGPIAYEFLFYQALETNPKISKDFKIKLMLYPKTDDDIYINLFESIFRECFTGEYEYWNILTFHSMVQEKEEIASVNELGKKEKLFKKVFKKIIKEYPEKQELYSVDNIFLEGVAADTKNREEIIEDFDIPEKGRIFLLASCKTLGEGIDTKYANMEIPINPGGSLVYEQQKLGRITRNPGGNQPDGIVLVPCWIDVKEYEGLDKYERDKLIKQELSDGGNFNTFLNVMCAYKNQCDPEIWELCIKYNIKFISKEIKKTLIKQGFKIESSQGTLIENINYLLDIDVTQFKKNTDEETIKNIVEQLNIQIDIYCQDLENAIMSYGSNNLEDPIILFKDTEGIYYPVTTIKSKKKKKIDRIFDIVMNDEIKILWKIDEDSYDISNTFCHGILNCEVKKSYNRFEIWYENLNQVEEYIKTNKKLPSTTDKNKEIKVLGQWLSDKKQKYKKEIYIMKEVKIRKAWEEFTEIYSEYFKDNNEIWYENLNQVEEYIKTNKKLPSAHNKNKEIKVLGHWLSDQKTNYKKEICIMKEVEIRKAWEEFTEIYSEYFKDNNEIWYENLNQVEEYIKTNKKLPSTHDKNKEIKSLGMWLSTQKTNYQKEIHIMKEVEIRKAWEEFTEKYSEYFKDNNEIWYEKLNQVEEYIKTNKKLPSKENKIKEIKSLGVWLSNQKKKYSKKGKIMKELKIRKSWEEFTEKYSEYFKDNNEIWYEKLNQVEEYIKTNKKLPSQKNKIKEIKVLGQWLSNQKQSYHREKDIMKVVEIRKAWKEFIEKYSEYFKDNNEIWYENLNQVEEYIKNNKKLPLVRDKNKKIKILGKWYYTQKQNYQKELFIMKEVEIKKAWEEFTEKYSEFFKNNNEKWYENLNKIEEYIKTNKKLPSESNKNKEIKSLCYWINNQKKKYKNNRENMKEVEIRKAWEEFTEKYSKYFTTGKISSPKRKQSDDTQSNKRRKTICNQETETNKREITNLPERSAKRKRNYIEVDSSEDDNSDDDYVIE